jgi:hypothetical protein
LLMFAFSDQFSDISFVRFGFVLYACVLLGHNLRVLKNRVTLIKMESVDSEY